MCYWATFISHAILVMVLVLYFYTEDLDGVGYTVKNFLFPDLFPYTGSEAVIMVQRWGVVLRGGPLKYFSYTSLLTENQEVASVTSWDVANKNMDTWGVVFSNFWGGASIHPANYGL